MKGTYQYQAENLSALLIGFSAFQPPGGFFYEVLVFREGLGLAIGAGA